MTAQAVVTYIRSLQKPVVSSYISCILARRQASHCTSYEGDRVILNQIRLTSNTMVSDDTPMIPPVVVPSGLKVVSSPVRPPTPAHFGQTINMPFSAARKEALFGNYSKMQATGTFGAPILCTSMPSNKSVLRSRAACRVKNTSIAHHYDLFARTCADRSTMKENVDFTDSYSPVASIDSI
jgi:hypothetical protein